MYIDYMQNSIKNQGFKVFTMVFICILLVDFIGFISWIVSGQQPMDNFYIGSITSNILNLFI